MFSSSDREIIIVGGSLSGLTLALACASRGIHTRVLERVDGKQKGGGALGIERALLMRVVGLHSPSESDVALFPALTAYRHAASWHAIHNWLLSLAARYKEITLVEGETILDVLQNIECATVVTADGQRINAPLVVGADGYRSVVRGAISPEAIHSTYAGYLLWRGLIQEADLPRHTRWPPNDLGMKATTPSGFYLSAFPVAGLDGSLEPGHRQINFIWYDSSRYSLLREHGCLTSEGYVLGYLTRESLPEHILNELQNRARLIWPEPWRTFVLHALANREVFGTPIAEYYPERLKRGRLAVIGDAAHVVAPATGRGFSSGILDAEALVGSILSGQDVQLALEAYEQIRLRDSQSLAASSMRWSRSYLRNLEKLRS